MILSPERLKIDVLQSFKYYQNMLKIAPKQLCSRWVPTNFYNNSIKLFKYYGNLTVFLLSIVILKVNLLTFLCSNDIIKCSQSTEVHKFSYIRQLLKEKNKSLNHFFYTFILDTLRLKSIGLEKDWQTFSVKDQLVVWALGHTWSLFHYLFCCG